MFRDLRRISARILSARPACAPTRPPNMTAASNPRGGTRRRPGADPTIAQRHLHREGQGKAPGTAPCLPRQTRCRIGVPAWPALREYPRRRRLAPCAAAGVACPRTHGPVAVATIRPHARQDPTSLTVARMRRTARGPRPATIPVVMIRTSLSALHVRGGATGRCRAAERIGQSPRRSDPSASFVWTGGTPFRPAPWRSRLEQPITRLSYPSSLLRRSGSAPEAS